MKNLFCRMLWEDPTKFDSKHPRDQKNIINYGLAISLIVMIEIFAGYHNIRNLFHSAISNAVFAAILWGIGIYIFEVLIIRSRTTKWSIRGRVVIGVIIALIGAFTVNSALFNKEIQAQLRENEKNRIVKSYDSDIKHQKSDRDFKFKDWKDKENIVITEAEGGSRTKVVGVGAVYKAKKQIADAAQQEYLLSEEKLSNIENEKKDAIKASYKNATEEAGFLSQIKAFFEFMLKDWTTFVIGMIFTIFILAIQLTILALKITNGTSIDDLKIDAHAEGIIADINNKRRIDASPLGMLGGILKPASEVFINNSSQN